MNERIRELLDQCTSPELTKPWPLIDAEKFAQLIVKEMCGLMEEAEDDAYHCFEPSELPTEYINWLRDWQERFTKHFGVEDV